MAVKSFLNLEEMDLEGKRVFLRLDLNVPLKDGKVLDDNRIQAAMPTLNYLIEKGAKVIVASHMGRPKTEEDRERLSLEPVARALNENGFEVLLVEAPDSDATLELIKGLSGKQIIMLENLRFLPGETKNSGELAAKWAKFTDVYVNDAFGASHRAHASIDALPKLIPERCYGFLIEKEIKALDKIKGNAPRPFVVLTGGSKVSDKIPLLEALADKVDAVIIGGAMAYSFLKAKGLPVGKSLVEENKISVAKRFLQKMENAGKEVYLPVDHIVLEDFNDTDYTVKVGAGISGTSIGVDIGPKTRELYSGVLKSAGSVFWNGPMGIYERKPFDEGSVAMAEALSQAEGITVIGGGDSAAAAIDSGFAEKMNHISTGGGASLEYIQGIQLPGLEALTVRRASE